MRKKNFLLGLFAALMVSLLSVGLVSCGDDEAQEISKADVISKIFGTWSNGSMSITFNKDHTGLVEGAYSGSEIPNGTFTYGQPQDIDTEDGETWFTLKISFTSGEAAGKSKEWDVVCVTGRQINIAGFSLQKR